MLQGYLLYRRMQDANQISAPGRAQARLTASYLQAKALQLHAEPNRKVHCKEGHLEALHCLQDREAMAGKPVN